VNRRELILLLGGAMTAPRTLRAQQKAMPVVGVLGSGSPGPFAPYVAAFHQGLSETGYVEGQNVTIEYRWAEDRYNRLPRLAADLIARKVDVIAAFGALLQHWQRRLRPRRSQSFFRAAIRSASAWSQVSPGRAVTSPALAAMT